MSPVKRQEWTIARNGCGRLSPRYRSNLSILAIAFGARLSRPLRESGAILEFNFARLVYWRANRLANPDPVEHTPQAEVRGHSCRRQSAADGHWRSATPETATRSG